MFALEKAAGTSPPAAHQPSDLGPRDARIPLIHFHGFVLAAPTQGNGPTAGMAESQENEPYAALGACWPMGWISSLKCYLKGAGTA